MLLLFLYMGRIPVPNKPLYDEPFRGRFDAAHPDLADAVTVPPVCQEEPYNPGRDVSINPNENSILTLWRRDYNQIRPHSALAYRPPAPEAKLPRPQALDLIPWSALQMAPSLT